MKFLLFILVCFFGLKTHAQYNNTGCFRKGEKLFEQKDYYAASQYYEAYLTVNKKSRASAQPFAVEKKLKGKNNLNPRQEAIYHLAECYRQQHDFLRAEKRYREACTFPRKLYPESLYWLGKVQLPNGHYDSAIVSFDAFIKEYIQMGPILNDADRQLDNLRFIQGQLRKPDQHAFALARQSIAGMTSAYALAVGRGDSSVLFTGIHTGGSGYKNDLFGGSSLADAAMLSNDADTSLQNGLAAFSYDGTRMFYTRWTKNNGVTHASIWTRIKLDTGWTQPFKPGEPMNIEGYNSTQPFITRDGKYLLFSSDRPGGQGKYDLWYAVLDSSMKPLFAANLGDKINSPGDEGSPFYHQNSGVLVFSSNGRVGMGGYDIYFSKGFLNLSQWDVPENPGLPINSSKDDAYFASTDEDNLWNTGWISSDRDSNSCCLALYTITQDNMQYISGRVVDCGGRQPLKDVRLTVTDVRHPGMVLSSLTTDSLGSYSFQLKNISRYRIMMEKEGFVSDAVPFLVHMRSSRDTVVNDALCLRAVAVPPAVAAHSSILGNFPYKKSSLPISVYQRLDSLVAVLKEHPGFSLQVEGYTDGIGGNAYNIRLSQARVDACIRYLVRKGITAGRLHGKSFGKCCPIEPEIIDGKDNPAGRELNRRVEYKVIQ